MGAIECEAECVQVAPNAGLAHPLDDQRHDGLREVAVDLRREAVLEGPNEAVRDRRRVADADVVGPGFGMSRQPDPDRESVSGANALDGVDETSALGIDHQHGPVRRERRVDQSCKSRRLAGARDADNRHVTRQFFERHFETLPGAQRQRLARRTNDCPEVRVGLGAIERLIGSDGRTWWRPPAGESDNRRCCNRHRLRERRGVPPPPPRPTRLRAVAVASRAACRFGAARAA